MPAHGASHTITGSGFGSKTGSAPYIWDNCNHGNNVLAADGGIWDRRWHDTIDGDEEDYRAPNGYKSQSVDPPHSRITKVLCGCSNTGGLDDANVYVSKDYTPPASEWWSVWVYWFRHGPNHTHEGDSNMKLHYWSRNGGHPASGGAYIEYRNPGDPPVQLGWTDGTTTGFPITLHNNGSPGLDIDPDPNQGGEYPTNSQAEWQHIECVIKHSQSSTDGRWKWRVNSTQMMDTAQRTHVSPTPSTFQESLGGFSRGRASTNTRYFADIYNDVQTSNPGRFYLTNNATWGSETIRAIQPWTSWSATSVTITVNGGALSEGTVHIHYRDEVNGHQYLGTFTLGGGFTGARNSFMRL